MGWMKANLLFFSILSSLLISPGEIKGDPSILPQEIPENLPQEILENAPPQVAQQVQEQEVALVDSLTAADLWMRAKSSKKDAKEGYTINYNTVSILEYIRFASKICKVNFIYEDADLNFNITVVSDEPITAKNVMATLVQVLRIHGLMLLEQDGSLVIHKSNDVKQMATLVTEDQKDGNSPIVTRIFRVKNAKAESIAAIIRPMISTGSVLEVSSETRQIILTDVTANVDKVAALVENLDSPYALLEIKFFEAVHVDPNHLVTIANQIMNPIALGNPFLLVPQESSNKIFVVSTPELTEKAMEVLASLDTAPKSKILAERKLQGENIFVYKVINRPGNDILKGLSDIAKNIQKSGIPESDLIETIDNAKWIPETNTITLVGSTDSIAKVKEFLAAVDVPSKEAAPEKSSFFVYRPQNKTVDEVEHSIREMAKNLKGTKGSDESLIETIDSVKINPSTNTLTFSGEEKNFARIKDLLATIDISSGKAPKPQVKNNFFVYKIQQSPAPEIESSLKEFAKDLDKSNAAEDGLLDAVHNMKYIKETNSILFTGPDPALKRIQELMPNFDVQKTPQIPASTQFYIYKPAYQKGENLVSSLKDVTEHLKSDKLSDPGLLHALESVKYVKSTNSLMFTGDPASLKKIESLISTLDVSTGPKPAPDKAFYLYQPAYASKEKTESYLKQVSENLNKHDEADLIDTIKTAKWIEPSHSFMFQGPEPSITRIKDLLKNFDLPSNAQPVVQRGFFLYQPQYASKDKVEQYLNQVASNLGKKSGEEDLISTIRSMKWVEPSHSFMFQGSETSNNRLKQLLQTFDTPASGVPSEKKGFFLYQLQFASHEKAEQYLTQVADSLHKKGGNEELVEVIRSNKWIPESHSIMFSGSDAAINQVKDLMRSYDTTEVQQKQAPKSGYYIYKLQNTTGDVIEEDLDSLAKGFKSSGMKDSGLVDVIEKMKYVKETNSLLLTGDPKAIDEVKALIAQYDYPRPTASKGPVNSNFFMYKPLHLTASQIQKSLHDVGTNLKKADLADPNLLTAIETAKYVETTNSLIFTGTPESLQKIQALIHDIDVAPEKMTPIQHVGKTTFLLYKLKTASGPQVVTSIKAMSADLKKSGNSDKDFLSALSSVKFVKDTNSLMFTGTEEALTKVQALVQEFDVSSLAAPTKGAPLPPAPKGASNFYVYKPMSLPGPELEKILQDFADNIRASGLNDPDLFDAIASIRWIEKTQSLVITGSPKALDQIKDLLKAFDIPSNLPEGAEMPPESNIQAIDNTSFLVYKLQFHKGDEIQGALRQIAKDLILSNAPVNQNLLNSINSIQWLETTNSLLSSGDQETLTRLRELIKNLDIPLKQVFIEMLVIQTTMTNALAFGLEWGGNYKYRNKFATNAFNTNPGALSAGNTTGFNNDQFTRNLAALTPATPQTATSVPTPQLIPPGAGFDLGVIGEVIRHNGQTYLTLGSLLQALQTDDESSVLMTPKIITQDGRTSTIFVGENIPFVGSFVNNVTNSTVNTANIEYRDIGLNLTITPVLGNSDIVTLDINLDRSQTVTDVTSATLNNNAQSAQGIITSKTTMQTTVHVPDDNFLILSGMVNNSNVKSKAGIPCLGGLPVIGAAFSRAADTVVNSNIVIFIRPHIINSIDDMRKLTAREEDYFRDQSGTPFLEHNFDESMELIKTADDE